jgi:thiosulfate dehydrogenase
MPYVGVFARYPQYRSRSAAVELIEDRVNDCFARSMNGTELERGGRDMHDIVAYLAWVSRGVAVGARVTGQGIDSVLPAPTPDTARGAAVYVAQCARCHGARGEGMVVPGPGLYAAPLWGDQSYNIGAGMARLRVTGAFIRHNMPYDQPGTLTAQQAFDVAAYVDAQPRPDYAVKDQDWPKGNPPADVAYGTRSGKAPRS